MFKLFALKSRTLLALMAAACAVFLGMALVLQHFFGVQTCPLCVLQRYVFIKIGLLCLLGALLNLPRLGALLALLASLAGTAIAGWQVWITRQPGFGCGYDPLENIVNSWFTAQALPFLFRAKGSCGDDSFRLFWLSLPQWALIAFVAFSIALLWVLLRRDKR